ALALTLNFLLTPMVMWLQRSRMRRGWAVTVVMLASTAIVAGMGWIVAGQLLQVASDLPKYRLNIHDQIDGLHLSPDSALGRAAASMKEIDSDFLESPAHPAQAVPSSALPPETGLPQSQAVIPVQVSTPRASGLQYPGRVLSPPLKPLGTAGMVVIFTVF